MAATFTLNGVDVLVPGQLIEQFDGLGYQTSDFKDIANQFVELRGVDPSYGYFLCTEDAINQSTIQQLVIQATPRTKLFKVRIEWAKKIGQAASEDKGFRLIKVVDDRYALANSYVGKRFNFVTDYIPNETGLGQGQFSYHDKSLKVEGEESSGGGQARPYTWEEIFDECWKLPGNPKLKKDNLKFPSTTPQDLDFRFVTNRDALEMLCQWTNTSIIYQAGEWKLVEVKDPPSQLNRFENFLIKNRYIRYKEPGEEKPQTLKVYLAKVDHSDNEVEEFKIFTKSTGANNNQTLDLRFPLYSTGTNDRKQEEQKAVDDFLDRCKKRWDQFPPQEKTYPTFFSFATDGTTEKVVYYQFDSGSYTRVRTICKREWLVRPKTLEQERYAHVIGHVRNDVNEGDSFFSVVQDKVIVGRQPRPEDVGFQINLTVRNTRKKSYIKDDPIDVVQRLGEKYWYPLGEGDSTRPIRRYELIEDKSTEDFAVKAWLLDDEGNPEQMPTQNPSPDLPPTENVQIYVSDAQQQFQGYAAYDDPLYGEQKGYTGWARFVFSDYFGKDLYEIVTMEHQARYVEARTPTQSELNDQDIPGVAIPGFNYWDGRPPKTEELDVGSSAEPLHVIRYLDRQSLFSIGKNQQVKLVWDESIKSYTVWATKQQTGGANTVKGRLTTTLNTTTESAQIKIESYTSSSDPSEGKPLTVHNPIDKLNPNNTQNNPRYLYLGNIDCVITASLYTKIGAKEPIWIIDDVQSPVALPQ